MALRLHHWQQEQRAAFQQRAAAAAAQRALAPPRAPATAPALPVPPPPHVPGNPLDTVPETALSAAGERTKALIAEYHSLRYVNSEEARARADELNTVIMDHYSMLAGLADSKGGFTAVPKSSLRSAFLFTELPQRLQALLWPDTFLAEAAAARAEAAAAAEAEELGHDWSSVFPSGAAASAASWGSTSAAAGGGGGACSAENEIAI